MGRAIGCIEHGLKDWAVYHRTGRSGTYGRCLACQRRRQSTRHNHGERCKVRGHLKTAWTWRFYSGHWRCLLCEYARRREREEERAG